MKETKADLVLHPIRMRIIQSFIGGRKLTTKQVAESLPDVPQATLYRHIEKLAVGGILQAAEERKIRGTKEITYALAEGGHSIPEVELAGASREELMKMFATFVSHLLGDFSGYLGRDQIDLRADGVGFRQAAIQLSDEEFADFARELGAVYAKVLPNEPKPGRKSRMVSTIILPGAEQPGKESS